MKAKLWLACSSKPTDRCKYIYFIFKEEPYWDDIKTMWIGKRFLTNMCRDDVVQWLGGALSPISKCQIELDVTCKWLDECES